MKLHLTSTPAKPWLPRKLRGQLEQFEIIPTGRDSHGRETGYVVIRASKAIQQVARAAELERIAVSEREES